MIDWSEVFKVLGTIIVAGITAFGGGYFSYKKFVIERNDAREEKNTQTLIDHSIMKMKEEMRVEIKEAVQKGIIDCGEIGDRAILRVRDDLQKSFAEGLEARGQEGAERFRINSDQISENSKQLAVNSKQIEEILTIVKGQTEKYDAMADSLTALNKLAVASAEAQCNSQFDRLLITTNKILKNGRMTITDKTNIKQLYESWKVLGGKDPKMETLYEECMKIAPVPDDAV